VSAAPAYCDQAAAASGSATTAIISTRMPGRASDVPPVARAGGESALTHASQTAFMPWKSAIFASQICTDAMSDFVAPRSATTLSRCAKTCCVWVSMSAVRSSGTWPARNAIFPMVTAWLIRGPGLRRESVMTFPLLIIVTKG